MTLILAIWHGKISTQSENQKRGNNNAGYGCSKTDYSTKVSDRTVISITDCTHGDNYEPKAVLKNHKVRLIMSLAEWYHLTQSYHKAHIKKDEKG